MSATCKILIFICSMLLNPGLACASNSAPGFISNINPTAYGAYIFSQSGSRTARPGCATENRWAIDTSTNAGQAMVATILSAYLAGKQIIVNGTGTCSVWGDTETASIFLIIG